MKKLKYTLIIKSVIALMFLAGLILLNKADKEYTDWPRVESCRTSMRGVQSALEYYRDKNKPYPDKLGKLISDKYLPEGGDLDPWGNRFYYEHFKGKLGGYYLSSNGKDGIFNTNDDVLVPINVKEHTDNQLIGLYNKKSYADVILLIIGRNSGLILFIGFIVVVLFIVNDINNFVRISQSKESNLKLKLMNFASILLTAWMIYVNIIVITIAMQSVRY